MKKICQRHQKIFGLSGLIGAWAVIGMVWAGMDTLPFITSLITGGFVGLTLIGVKT
jgi:hypothetical protein